MKNFSAMKKMNKDMIIKIISGILMLGVVVFLANKNAFIFDDLEKVVQGNADVESRVIPDTKEAVSHENVVVPVAATVSENNNTPVVSKYNFSHQKINAQEYKEKLESGEYVHIDIRTPQEYNAEKISEGLNIDFYETSFLSQLDGLDKSKKYIYHCRSGSRSANAVAIFKELGFGEIYELEGGINNWKQSYSTL